MADSADIAYIVMRKRGPCTPTMDAIADALGTSLSLHSPVFLQVGLSNYIEVDGSVALDTIEAVGRRTALPTGER